MNLGRGRPAPLHAALFRLVCILRLCSASRPLTTLMCSCCKPMSPRQAEVVAGYIGCPAHAQPCCKGCHAAAWRLHLDLDLSDVSDSIHRAYLGRVFSTVAVGGSPLLSRIPPLGLDRQMVLLPSQGGCMTFGIRRSGLGTSLLDRELGPRTALLALGGRSLEGSSI